MHLKEQQNTWDKNWYNDNKNRKIYWNSWKHQNLSISNLWMKQVKNLEAYRWYKMQFDLINIYRMHKGKHTFLSSCGSLNQNRL